MCVVFGARRYQHGIVPLEGVAGIGPPTDSCLSLRNIRYKFDQSRRLDRFGHGSETGERLTKVSLVEVLVPLSASIHAMQSTLLLIES